MEYKRKYLINYKGGSQSLVNKFSKQLNIGDVIITVVNKYLGDENNIFILEVDSDNIFDGSDNKIEGYQDYKIGIVIGDGKFVKRDHSLKINGFRHKRCNGCTTWIRKKEKRFIKDNAPTIEKAMFPIDKDQFKFCQSKGSDIFELNPIKIIGKIESIDPINKFIDISISEYYFQTNMC